METGKAITTCPEQKEEKELKGRRETGEEEKLVGQQKEKERGENRKGQVRGMPPTPHQCRGLSSYYGRICRARVPRAWSQNVKGGNGLPMVTKFSDAARSYLI